jgi:hypothetical protein
MAFSRPARARRSLQHPPELAAILAGRQHEQLARNELVAALLRQLVGDVQQLVEVVAEQHLAARTLDLRQRSSAADSSERSFATLAPAFSSSGRAVPPCWSSNAAIRCTGSMY